jgi:hypothetical protein
MCTDNLPKHLGICCYPEFGFHVVCSVIECFKVSGKSSICLNFIAAPKFMSTLAQNGSIDEEQVSSEQLDIVYSPLRELVSENIHQQESILERVQVGDIYCNGSCNSLSLVLFRIFEYLNIRRLI